MSKSKSSLDTRLSPDICVMSYSKTIRIFKRRFESTRNSRRGGVMLSRKLMGLIVLLMKEDVKDGGREKRRKYPNYGRQNDTVPLFPPRVLARINNSQRDGSPRIKQSAGVGINSPWMHLLLTYRKEISRNLPRGETCAARPTGFS